MKDTVSLNKIVIEAYENKEGRKLLKGEKDDKPVKNYYKECRKKLIEICGSLNCDFEEFKSDNNYYEFPISVATIFKTYLLEDSKNGSFISKLRKGRFLDITFEEKRNFIDKIKVNLKEEYKECDLKENVYIEIEDICRDLLKESEYSERVKDIVTMTQFISSVLVEASLIKLSGIDAKEGLLGVVDPDKQQYYDVKEDKKICNLKITADKKLNNPDKLVMMEYLETCLKEKINEWIQIVNIAGEIREQDVEDYKFENRDMLESKELLINAIKEFENEKNQEKDNIVEKIHTKEEFSNILNEIRRDLNKQK